ncbi:MULTISPECIES: 1-deoxy-D-xylulose-5-phosphate synthase [unclassified Luteococcus]|uniref:1-deoxy-D-xylulose-5-phosphate synthase n=1 Tax=unclassified Luteococcus TaxID=2639923 RepID=UPI00313A9E83
MALLDQITQPSDLRALSREELDELAREIRAFLVTNVSRTGGHLGPNLGVVELTIALHRVFDSPHDPLVFDTGHQSYVHKILTGRAGQFEGLRQKGGLSGYPSRAESEHDWVENSHASTSLSWGEGLAKAFRLRGEDRTVVVVVGDGALTGGMTWEALNNIAVQEDLKLVIVVNDNGRSYTPTVGGLATHLAGMRTDRRYEQALGLAKRGINKTPVVGKPAYDLLHGMKTGLKDVLAPQGMFSDLGIKYLGPIDGHDEDMVERALEQAKGFGGPVLVHAITQKGRGFKFAEDNEEDRFHAVGQINELTGEPLSASVQATWTDAFSDHMVKLGDRYPELVAITAAMLHPVGLARFSQVFPERVFDVGIAEQHAVTSAAGLAAGGLHPVVAVYSTFLNRAFDQLLMDVALHKQGVTFCLDRAGVTGSDGASHNGMWDVSMCGLVPGLRLASPRDRQRMEQALETAIGVDDAPTVVRWSKEKLPDPIPAIRQLDGMDLLRITEDSQVLVVGHGQFMGLALDVAERLGRQGVRTSVVDPVWSLPVNPSLVDLAARHQLVVNIEDSMVVGGTGSHLSEEMRRMRVQTPLMCFGIPQTFLDHASRTEVLAAHGLTGQDIAREVLGCYLAGTSEVDAPSDATRPVPNFER